MSEAQTACPPLRGGCPAMLGLLAPSRNSLRSLRSLRSDRRDESVDEARVARSQQPCASRRRRFAPPTPRPPPCGQWHRLDKRLIIP